MRVLDLEHVRAINQLKDTARGHLEQLIDWRNPEACQHPTAPFRILSLLPETAGA